MELSTSHVVFNFVVVCLETATGHVREKNTVTARFDAQCMNAQAVVSDQANTSEHAQHSNELAPRTARGGVVTPK